MHHVWPDADIVRELLSLKPERSMRAAKIATGLRGAAKQGLVPFNLPSLNGRHVQSETVDGASSEDGEDEAREEVCAEEQEQVAQLEGGWSKVLGQDDLISVANWHTRHDVQHESRRRAGTAETYTR